MFSVGVDPFRDPYGDFYPYLHCHKGYSYGEVDVQEELEEEKCVMGTSACMKIITLCKYFVL